MENYSKLSANEQISVKTKLGNLMFRYAVVSQLIRDYTKEIQDLDKQINEFINPKEEEVEETKENENS